jgi:hypothetical protein
MKKVLAFPSYFFCSVVAQLDFEELDGFTPCEMILLIQDFDWWSGYNKSASSGVTLGNMMSMGAFKYFFNCNTWKISWTPAKDGGRSSL